jgi:endonuclease/exonuclease/phosphatase family metal-dependent hydrolase
MPTTPCPAPSPPSSRPLLTRTLPAFALFRALSPTMRRAPSRTWALALALFALLHLPAGHAWTLFGAAPASEGLTLATWNLDWLMTPAAHDELAARCVRQQPRSDMRALPCTPGRTPPPSRTSADYAALSGYAAQLAHHPAGLPRADVVALQEVDGPDAAKLVFQQGWKLDCFTARAHPQKVGFAIREGLPYRCNGDLAALDVDGATRAGADITLWPGTPQATRLLAVHLKSGCFDGALTRHFSPCERLRQQVPVVEAWIDARVREGTPFAVLGDFNRHLDRDARASAGPDEAAPLNLMQAWSDQQPPGAVLLRATEGQRYLRCDAEDHHSQYIDDILIDRKLAGRYTERQMRRLGYSPSDQGFQLSDHCPLIWSLR